MKKNTTIFGIISFILIIMSNLFFNEVKGEILSPELYFGIQEIDEGSSMGYSIGNPRANGDGSTGGPSAKIWNIIQYDNASGANARKTNLYCVRAGAGFTSSAQTGLKLETYNLKFDMYTERDEIASQDENTSNKILHNLVTGGHYNELLALANLLYVPGISTNTEKQQLLDVSGVTSIWEEIEGIEGDQYYHLTDDEIEAVQQSAIWYFTNYDEMYDGERKYDKTDDTDWLWYTTDSSEYKNLSDYNPTNTAYAQTYAGSVRQDQAEALYDYLIKTAKANASHYENGTGKYKLTLYATSKDRDAQPLMEIERNPQEFDLALRKSIVSVTNSEGSTKEIKNIEGENATRQLNTNGTVKNINKETIQGAKTTAEYYNRKDPVVVSTGDYITYSISIYNEGEKEGRATKIIDQLPEGLEFTEVVSGNFTVLTGGYNKTTNRLTLTRKTGNTTNLPAYDGTTLSSEVVQIKCKITGTAGARNKILTNMAWISEEVDGVTGETITTQSGKDRDSEPSTIQTQTKDQLVTEDEGYRGNTSNNGKDITDNNSYFEGQQDDDDFEKVIIQKAEGSYNIQLEKVDEEGNRITTSGAGFRWTLPGGRTQNGTTVNGLLDLGTVEITQTGTDSITITETSAPEGYNALIESITVQITKELSNGNYVATNAQIISGNSNGNASVKIENGIIKITIKNKPIEGNYRLQLEKVDEEGRLITTSNAGFSWRLPGEGENRTEETSNGILDLGTVEITQIGKDNITITETKAPEGYNALIESITVEVTKELSNGNYVATNAQITSGNTNGNASVKIEEGIIKITVKNTPKEFDLALRKFITKVDETQQNREPQPDTSTIETEGTAQYNHTKEPIMVNRESEITYTIRVYNEGEVDGYAQIVTDYIPEGLEFLPENGVNQQYGWVMYNAEGEKTENAEEAVEIRTNYLSKEKNESENLIKAYDGKTLSYKELQVVCKVKADVESNVKLTNLAEITEDYNEYDYPDKDSTPENMKKPTGEDLPNYKDDEIEEGKPYIPGQEDDDDFEKVLVAERAGSYELQLQKVDEEGNLITTSGAEFSWTLPGEAEQNTHEGTTEEGKINLGTVQITDIGNVDTIKVVETKAPEGYNGLEGDIVVEVQKGISEEDSNKYEATNARLTSGEDKGAKVELNGNVITITVPNTPIEGNYKLQLEKVDEEGNLITTSNAGFSWRLPGEGEDRTGETLNGTLDLGTVEMTEEGTDSITITETKAPEGYNALIESITVEITKELSNGNYIAQKDIMH